MDLKGKKCAPCSGLTPALSPQEKLLLKAQLHRDWELNPEATRLRREFKFKNFRKPLELANKVGEIADQENHHPEIHLGWGHCDFEIWTHANGDLTENDFILAAQIDELTQRP